MLQNHQSEDIIVHLKVNLTKINENTPTYSPNIHTPLRRDTPSASQYEWIMDSSPNANPDFYDDSLKPMEPFAKYPFNKNNNNNNQPSMDQSIKNNLCIPSENKKIQHTKNIIKCFWCCHTFPTEPCYLPLYIKDDEFVVYGLYCSPECAAAYNFNDVIDFGNAQDRYSLLHSLYFGRFQGKKINLAPSRLSLDIFGGNLSIDEFRDVSSNDEYDYSISISPIPCQCASHL